MSFASAANSIVRIFLAPACAACRAELERPLESPVCDNCWRQISAVTPPWCARCGDALTPQLINHDTCYRCQQRPPSFTVARSAADYDGPLRELIHAFKFNNRRLLAEPLGRMMRFAGADVLHGVDAVVPVPLHPWRSFRRGFNQADDLACQLGLPVWRALRRRRAGPPQASLPASDRRRNLVAAFAVSPIWRARERWRRACLTGRIVVLVDDVMTTGATLDACGAVLMDAGVSEVRALTAARAVATRHRPPLA